MSRALLRRCEPVVSYALLLRLSPGRLDHAAALHDAAMALLPVTGLPDAMIHYLQHVTAVLDWDSDAVIRINSLWPSLLDAMQQLDGQVSAEAGRLRQTRLNRSTAGRKAARAKAAALSWQRRRDCGDGEEVAA
jgi:hypothetical protein